MAKKISDLLASNEFTGAEIESGMAFEVYDPTGATDVDKSGAVEVEELQDGLWRLYTQRSNIVIGGGSTAITTGIKGDVVVPYKCVLTGVTALADQTGSIVVDIWKDTYANYPPTDADSITASAPVTISSATKSQDTTLTGWTTALAQGDILRFNVDSATSITRLTLILHYRRSI